jgi:hypothetical protein
MVIQTLKYPALGAMATVRPATDEMRYDTQKPVSLSSAREPKSLNTYHERGYSPPTYVLHQENLA